MNPKVIERLWVGALVILPMLAVGFFLIQGDSIPSMRDGKDRTLPQIDSGNSQLASTPADELRQLIIEGQVDVLEQTLSGYGFQTVNQAHKGMTPLMLASSSGSEPIVELLFAFGADPNIRGGQQRTALQYAIEGNHLQISKRLIAGGADINATDDTNLSPLVMAVDREYDEIAYYLLDAGADPNVQHRQGYTALIDAARNGNMTMVKALVRAGADTQASLPDGRNASDIAQQLQKFEIAVYLTAINIEEPTTP